MKMSKIGGIHPPPYLYPDLRAPYPYPNLRGENYEQRATMLEQEITQLNNQIKEMEKKFKNEKEQLEKKYEKTIDEMKSSIGIAIELKEMCEFFINEVLKENNAMETKIKETKKLCLDRQAVIIKDYEMLKTKMGGTIIKND